MTSEWERQSLIKVEIAPNQLAAVAWVEEPPSEDIKITESDIRHFLQEKGVSYGIQDDKIRELLTAPYGVKVRVAEGKPRKNGEKARLEYLFDLGKLTPKELENGRVDYFELGYVKNVVAGQVLVRKTPATPGEVGITVTGKKIPPVPGKDISLPAGKHTEISPNGLELRSKIQGHVFIKNNKVMVENVFIVAKDVDVSIGNINFLGRVTIRGNVSDRIKIVAQDDIEIHGDVGAAHVESSAGNIKVSKGVFGRGVAVLKARKNIYAKFVEQATLETGGDVLVQQHILHSTIRAEGKVAILSDPGVIAGGEVLCIESLYTRDLGSESQPKTRVEVNDFTAPPILEALSKLSSERSALKARLVNCERALKELREIGKRDDALAKKRREELLEIARPYRYQYPRLCLIEHEAERKKSALKQLDSPQEIVCLNKVYPGVIIKMGQQEMKITQQLQRKRFRLIAGKSISVRDL